MAIRFLIILGYFVVILAFSLQAANVHAQTLHNEPHKAYGEALNSSGTRHCFGADIDYERNGQYAQSDGTVVPPTIRAICTQPASEFLTAFNYAGKSIEQDGVTYLRYVGWEVLEGGTIADTWLTVSGDTTFNLVTPPGKYRIVAYQKPSTCGGWQFELGGATTVGAITDENIKHDLLVSFDSWQSKAVFTANDCSVNIYAVEFYRVR